MSWAAIRLAQALVFLLALAWAFDDSAPRRVLESVRPDDPGYLDGVSVAEVMAHLEVIARAPRYIGTPEHERVRNYVAGKLREFGLETEIAEHSMPGELRLGSSGFRVFNVLGRLKGSQPGGKAVLLVSHYDSVLNSPGAADDGAGVAGMLVVAEKMALRSKLGLSPPKNDILFLFTDAEEVCLCGAKAFVEQHRWAKDVGVVLNFEARGNTGSSIMFETSDGNAALIRAFAEFAPRPSTNSLTYEVYKRLPNDTDLTMFKMAGHAGLNFAFIGALKRYHSPEDTPANINRASVAHHGANMMAAARHFGDANLETFRPGKKNAVYFDLAGLRVIRYSELAARLLGLLAAGLWVAALGVGIRRRHFPLRRAGLQALAMLIVTLLTLALAWMLTLGWTRILIGILGFPQLDVLTSKAGFLALLVLCCSVFSVLFQRWNPCRGWFPMAGLWLAPLTPLSLLFVPGASYLFTWPLLLLSVAQLAQYSGMGETRPRATAVATTVLMIPLILILGTTVNGVFTAMTLGMLPIQVFLAILLVSPLMSQMMHTAGSRASATPPAG